MAQVDTKVRADYTEGSITGSIMKMGLPSMFGFLVQHIYAMTDMFWVSRLPGQEAGVAAITFFNSLMWILFSFNSLVGPGSVAVISRRYGEKEFDKAESAIKETILLKVIFGGALGLFGWFFVGELLALVGASGESLTLGVRYGRIILVFLPIMYATYSIFTALRGIANPKWAMGLMIASNIMNLVLDPILIFGYLGFPAYGIEGAAYASVTSFTITFGVGLLLFKTDIFNVRLNFRNKVPVTVVSMWKIVKIGIPAWAGDLSFSGSRMMLTPIIAGYGTAVVAAYGVGLQLYAFGIMILVGIGLGLSSLIGHNIGAGKFERAKQTADRAILMGLGFMSFMGVLTYIFGQYYMNIFFDSPETIAAGTTLLRIWAVGFPAIGAFIILEQIHSGVGLNVPFMIISFIHAWLLQVIPALIATQWLGWGQEAIWWILALAGIVTSIGFYIYYRRGRWLTVKL